MRPQTQTFQAKLAKFRTIAKQPRAVVCDRLEISNSTYGRMAAIVRAEEGGKTKQQQFFELVEAVDLDLGDREPISLSPAVMARQFGCNEGQAIRVKQILTRKRNPTKIAAAKTDLSTTDLAEPKRPKTAKLFWTLGSRLFCENRQPQEVGR